MMDLSFREASAKYSSGSQKARVWTEQWVAESLFCPNCGNYRIRQFPPNLPVADFFCTNCGDQYELKSQKKPFTQKVADGAYETKQRRLLSDSSPNLMLLNYDIDSSSVRNLFVVPKHFFVASIVERRKPLAQTARRAGWVGSNILLHRIPASGRIFIVRDGVPIDKDAVLTSWARTLFLRQSDASSRTWLMEVMRCLESLPMQEFGIEDAYRFEDRLKAIYPNNRNVRPKIRQQLQILRDNGYLEFRARGRYRLLV